METDALDYCDPAVATRIVARAMKGGMSKTKTAAELGVSTQALDQWARGEVDSLKPATARAVRRLDRRLK